MPSILDKIVAKKREELAVSMTTTPWPALRDSIAARPAALDFAGALRGEGISLIAEVKKASPSKGLLRPDFRPTELAATYATNGAAAISVITDSHFLGEPAHLMAVKESGASGSAPVLRKDFLFDPYQIYEARAIGADTYLLIVDILSPAQLAELIDVGRTLGMTPLVETHDADEIAMAVDAGAEIIGINNRDLHTFVTDLATTEALAPLIPSDKIVVSESGISAPEDLARLEPFGISAVLVGEALVTADDTAAKVRSLTGAPALSIEVVTCRPRRSKSAASAGLKTRWSPRKQERITWASFSYPAGVAGSKPSEARVITDRLRAMGRDAPRSVGLFGDQPLSDVLDTIAVAGLDLAQLCGEEPADYCRRVQENADVIKVLHVPNDTDADAIANVSSHIADYAAAGCIVTLDSQVAGLHGGTGQSFDWSVAAQLAASGRQFLLAGGLTPENVAEAVALARPWGVDVSSGVETDGEKDAGKIRRFVANARLLD